MCLGYGLLGFGFYINYPDQKLRIFCIVCVSLHMCYLRGGGVFLKDMQRNLLYIFSSIRPKSVLMLKNMFIRIVLLDCLYWFLYVFFFLCNKVTNCWRQCKNATNLHRVSTRKKHINTQNHYIVSFCSRARLPPPNNFTIACADFAKNNALILGIYFTTLKNNTIVNFRCHVSKFDEYFFVVVFLLA